jgi:ornithine carbamoyltransferase
MEFRVASPADYSFSVEELAELSDFAAARGRGGTVRATNDPADAAAGVDAFYADVWTSMGQEDERAARLRAFDGFTIDDALVSLGGPGAVVLHCLPAHRGEEISAAVFEGPQSVVWRQAAHRRTAMRGILTWSMEAEALDAQSVGTES